MIHTENLQKVYRTDEVETTALSSVNLDVDAGEFVSVMGPSGCGKLTLLNVLGLLDNPSSGTYRFRDTEVADLSERKSRVADMLDRFGIVAKKKLFPSQLSGGQQQLVGVARALVAEPRLILADEPTGNLRSERSEQIMELFQRLNRRDGVTIIQATHSERQAAYGDRIVYLEDGRVQEDYTSAEGKPERIRESARES